MTILVDELCLYGKAGGKLTWWCHMTSDTDEAELHAAARAIGLERSWYRDHCNHPHYDITPARRADAIRHGAVEVKGTELVRRCWKNKWLRDKLYLNSETREQE